MSENILESQLFEIIKNEEMAENIKLAKIDMLIRLGVDVNAMYGAKSALKLAKDNNLKKVAELLENNSAKDVFDEKIAEELGVKLIKACKGKEKDAKEIMEIKELINMGADVNQKDISGISALGYASTWWNKEIAEILIQNGADVNQKDSNGKNALGHALIWEHKEIVKLLISRGADVNQKDEYGNTVLIWASSHNYTEIVELLIQKEADVNQKNNNNGKTALIVASRNGCKEVVELLIQKGADVHQKDNDGQNAMMVAYDNETKKAIMDAVKKRNEKENGDSFFSKIKRRLGIDM